MYIYLLYTLLRADSKGIHMRSMLEIPLTVTFIFAMMLIDIISCITLYMVWTYLVPLYYSFL